MMEVLLTRRGFRVTCAYDGVQAIEMIGENDFDLVFLDLMLPRLSGLDVLKRIRANPATENLPVVVVTAKTGENDVFESYHHGADMHLIKPLNVDDIEWLGRG